MRLNYPCVLTNVGMWPYPNVRTAYAYELLSFIRTHVHSGSARAYIANRTYEHLRTLKSCIPHTFTYVRTLGGGVRCSHTYVRMLESISVFVPYVCILCIYICTYMNVCKHIRTYERKRGYIHTYENIEHLCMYMYVYVCIYVRICMSYNITYGICRIGFTQVCHIYICIARQKLFLVDK